MNAGIAVRADALRVNVAFDVRETPEELVVERVVDGWLRVRGVRDNHVVAEAAGEERREGKEGQTRATFCMESSLGSPSITRRSSQLNAQSLMPSSSSLR